MEYDRKIILDRLNELYISPNWDYFNNLDIQDKCLIIKEMFYDNSTKNIDSRITLTVILIENFCKMTKNEWGIINIPNFFVNLLCIILAKTHDAGYLKYIVNAKRSGNLFYYIDSTLLFEFSPKGNKDTCVEDTKELAKTFGEYEEDSWEKIFYDWVFYYSDNYDETTVKKYWNSYKTPEFKKRIYDSIPI